MNIHWESLLAVFAVSFGSTIAVVTLVGLVSKNGILIVQFAVQLATTALRTRLGWSRATGTAVAVVGLGLAALIVLIGLWEIVAK